MKSYQDCVNERFQAAGRSAPRVEAAVGDNSVINSFLRAAGRAEVDAAERDLRELRNLDDDRAVKKLIEDRRGDAVDMVVSALASGASGVIGAGVGEVAKQTGYSTWLAALPGLAMAITGLTIKQSYPVRQGLFQSGLNWIGAAVTRRDK